VDYEQTGYRYDANRPESDGRWPSMPASSTLAKAAADEAGFRDFFPMLA